MKFIKIISAILISYLASSAHAASTELTPENIKSLVGSGSWLIEHFSPYCGHCRNFAPDWKRLTEDLASLEIESDFHFGTIDCTVQGDLCNEHGVTGFPTLQLWDNGEKIERYNGLNQYDPLTEYIYDKIKSLKSSTEESSLDNEEGEGVVEEEEEDGDDDELDIQGEVAETEEEEAQAAVAEEEEEAQAAVAEEAQAAVAKEEEEGKAQISILLPNPKGISVNLNEVKLREISTGTIPWFVKFYAPWCGHCKALAPTWVDLGTQLSNQVNIGEVNCVELPSLCSEFGIQGFPTLKMFSHEKVINYNGDRSLVSLLEFAIEHSDSFAVKDITDNVNDEKIVVASSQTGFNWIFKHWIICIIGFSIFSSFVYRYLTFHGSKKGGILPFYKPVIDTHKD